jgi:hypothetical protein
MWEFKARMENAGDGDQKRSSHIGTVSGGSLWKAVPVEKTHYLLSISYFGSGMD